MVFHILSNKNQWAKWVCPYYARLYIKPAHLTPCKIMERYILFSNYFHMFLDTLNDIFLSN